MKRRIFLERIGWSVPTVYYGSRLSIDSTVKFYPETLAECVDQEGRIALRLAFSCSEDIGAFEGRISVSKGHLADMRVFDFGTVLEADGKSGKFSGKTISFKEGVMVCWIKEWTKETRINIVLNGEKDQFTLGELPPDGFIAFEGAGDIRAVMSILSYKETGKVSTESLGISNRENFMCCLFADTQGGDPTDQTNDSPTRVKIHNAFIEESIRLANEQENPAFHIIIGDIVDSKGQWSNYRTLLDMLKRLEAPVLFSVGNHETAYGITFSPGHSLEGFENYFQAQSDINGLSKLLYSFDVGEWHFVVWPDPLRDGFWEHHPHYFDWLEKDLLAHKSRQTVFLHHVPIMPIGIDPLVSYVESRFVRNTLLDILSAHGNVKYAISGHVHIPMRASMKTLADYKGIRFVNLPAAGYRPRAFGEPDLDGNPIQGIARMTFSGKQASLDYITVTGEVFDYTTAPAAHAPYDNSLWDISPCRLPLNQGIRNGSFENGLSHWFRQYVYQEEEDPSNGMEAVRHQDRPALLLYSASRKFHIPGQDRMPQTINYLAQAVEVGKGDTPGFTLDIFPDAARTLKNSFNGIYIWLEGFQACFKRLNLVYSFNPVYFGIGGKYADVKEVRPVHLDLSLAYDQWNSLVLNVPADYLAVTGQSFAGLGIDRLVINLGSWTINDGQDQQAAAYLTDITLHPDMTTQPGSNGNKITPKKERELWYGGIDHIAGEHIYRKTL